MHRLARIIRNAAIALARRPRVHEFLCAAGFDQALLDTEGLRDAVERAESLTESDHALV